MQFPSNVVDRQAFAGSLHGTQARLSRAQRALLRWAMVDDHMAVLELNCGEGQLLNHLQQRYHIRACGICFDAADAQRARRALPAAEILYVQGTEIPWQEHSFDRVLCAGSSMQRRHLKEWVQALSRVIRPGGQVLVALALLGSGFSDGALVPRRKDLLCAFSQAGFRDVGYRFASPSHGIIIARK